MDERAVITAKIKELEEQLRDAKATRRRMSRGMPGDEPGAELYFAIGSAIRAARVNADLTQQHVAGEVGVLRTSIVNIEQGRQRLPIDLLYDIADVVGVQTVSLLPRNEDV